MSKDLRKVRLIIWSIPVLCLIYLVVKGISPGGRAAYIYRFDQSEYFISKLKPEERVSSIDNNQMAVIGDPVYFTLRTLRPFDWAKLTLEFKNDSSPIIEAGVLADKNVWRYDLKPAENKIIDKLVGEWTATRQENVLLLQRKKKYSNVDDFLKHLPLSDEIAVYNYDLKTKFIIKNYQPADKEWEIKHPLRGGYQVYTYIKNEKLFFKFYFSDLNKNKDKDDIDISLYRGSEKIDGGRVEDPFDQGDNGIKEGRGVSTLEYDKLPEGYYKIEIKANDDIITEKIISKQRKIVFPHLIRLSGNSQSGIDLVTDSGELSAQTINPASLQSIAAGRSKLALKETYRQYSLVLPEKLTSIKLAKDDVILGGDGVFSFSRENYFNPEQKKVGKNFRPENINYIIARYNPPRENNGWKTVELDFDLRGAYNEPEKSIIPGLNKLSRRSSFIISIPGLKADDEKNDQVIIKEIKIELEGKNLWEMIKSFL